MREHEKPGENFFREFKDHIFARLTPESAHYARDGTNVVFMQIIYEWIRQNSWRNTGGIRTYGNFS